MTIRMLQFAKNQFLPLLGINLDQYFNHSVCPFYCLWVCTSLRNTSEFHDINSSLSQNVINKSCCLSYVLEKTGLDSTTPWNGSTVPTQRVLFS